MIPQILVHPELRVRAQHAEALLHQAGISKPHPDLLWLEGEKLGVEQAKAIRSHLSLKPFQAGAKAVVIVDGENLTPDAQNALLKTLEEPSGETVFVIGTQNSEVLLPTILSRCQLLFLEQDQKVALLTEKEQQKVETFLRASLSEKFSHIEKLDDRVGFLTLLTDYCTQEFRKRPSAKRTKVLYELIQAQLWLESNVTPRAVLEYIALYIDQNSK
jgi:hypothetical protein